MKYAITLAALATLALAGEAQARDEIRIVGSSTVFPFSTAVAEQFGKAGSFKTPVVESTGTGGGIKLFCAGVGVDHPDIANASRAIKDSELEACKKNGVTEITEVKIGYDGIVLANSKATAPMNLTIKSVFLALAKQVPVDGKLVDNPYKTWSEIDPSLPNAAIEVLGPPPTSGTRDAFVELVMDKGCGEFAGSRRWKATPRRRPARRSARTALFVEAGENDNLIVQKLEANPAAVGIFGFSFLDQNADKVQGSAMDGVDADLRDHRRRHLSEVSRPLFFYVKNAHVGVIPGLKEFVAEFMSDQATGDEGYLADKGLIPLPASDARR